MQFSPLLQKLDASLSLTKQLAWQTSSANSLLMVITPVCSVPYMSSFQGCSTSFENFVTTVFDDEPELVDEFSAAESRCAALLTQAECEA